VGTKTPQHVVEHNRFVWRSSRMTEEHSSIPEVSQNTAKIESIVQPVSEEHLLSLVTTEVPQ
jgi:hypothetical protein